MYIPEADLHLFFLSVIDIHSGMPGRSGSAKSSGSKRKSASTSKSNKKPVEPIPLSASPLIRYHGFVRQAVISSPFKLANISRSSSNDVKESSTSSASDQRDCIGKPASARSTPKRTKRIKFIKFAEDKQPLKTSRQVH